MGCFLYYKVPISAITRYDILVFFMHSDSWGQYGEETSDVPKLDRFIGDSEINEDLADRIDANNLVADGSAAEDQGYHITNDGGDVAVGFDYNVAFDSDYEDNDTKQCPFCRTENRIVDVKKIYGSSDTCSICYEKNVEHFFSQCGHACICDSCFQHL